MERKKLLAASFIIAAFVISIKPANCAYSISNFSAKYMVLGKISMDMAQVSVNTDATADVKIYINKATVNVTYDLPYFVTELPYGLNDSIFILTSDELASETISNVPLLTDTEMNPFYETYGLKYFYINLENEIAKYECKWEFYSGVLIHLEIDVKETIYEHLTYRCTWTSFDMYAPYQSTYVSTVNVIKILASPIGFMTIVIGAFAIVIVTSMLIRSKKMTKIPTREARVMKK